MKKVLNEGYQIYLFYFIPVSSSGSGTVIIYDYGSGSSSTGQKVTVPTVPVPVPQHWLWQEDERLKQSKYLRMKIIKCYCGKGLFEDHVQPLIKIRM